MKGWTKRKLGAVCTLQRGFDLPKKSRKQGCYPLFSSSGCIDTHSEAKVKSPNVVTGRSGSIGSVFFVDEDFWPLNTTLYVKDFHGNNPRFIFYLLKNLNLNRFASGSGVPTLNRNIVHEELVKVPCSLSEQKRIVAILDEAFEGIDRAIANTEKNLANARELFESYLNAVFTQKGDDWVEKKLGEVCKFQGGSQPPKSEFSTAKKEGYIRLIQIRDYKSDKHIVYIPKHKAKRFCDSDDVMIGRYGPPLFQILRGIEGAYNVALMKAIPDESIISKDYLFYFLQNRRILNYVINSSNRAAGQAGVNKKTLNPYPLVFPSLDKQSQLVSKIKIVYEESQKLEAIYQRQLEALQELKQSILHKAFTGELTNPSTQLRENPTVKEDVA